MKLGVFTCLLQNLPLEEALKYFKSLGIEMIELGDKVFPIGNKDLFPLPFENLAEIVRPGANDPVRVL